MVSILISHIESVDCVCVCVRACMNVCWFSCMVHFVNANSRFTSLEIDGEEEGEIQKKREMKQSNTKVMRADVVHQSCDCCTVLLRRYQHSHRDTARDEQNIYQNTRSRMFIVTLFYVCVTNSKIRLATSLIRTHCCRLHYQISFRSVCMYSAALVFFLHSFVRCHCTVVNSRWWWIICFSSNQVILNRHHQYKHNGLAFEANAREHSDKCA